jgi:hypothetical protein
MHLKQLPHVNCGCAALDPASPCFADVDKDLRLDPNDADFVDVIHTNGKDKFNLGLEKPVGSEEILISY